MSKNTKRQLTIWVVASEVPSLRGGAPVRNYNLIKQYAAEGHRVTVFCIADRDSKGDVKQLKALPNVRVIPSPLPKLSAPGQLLAAVLYRVLPFMRQYRASGLANELLDMLTVAGAPDIVQLEQVNGYYAAKPVLGKLRSAGARIVLDAHNLEQQALEASLEVFSPVKRLLGKYILPRYRRLENRYARQADMVFACSEADREFFAALNTETVLVPNGVDVDYFVPQPDTDKPALLFMGGTGYPPNADGLRWYVEAIHPLVKKAVPSVKLYTIGGQSPGWLIDAAKKDASLQPTGYVDDVRDYLKKAAVCISPIRKGSGTSLKILEYCASARAVVSTTIGMRGIHSTPGKDIVLADKPDDFANAVIDLLTHAKKRQQLGEQARVLMTKIYTWRQISLVATTAFTKHLAAQRVHRHLVSAKTLTLSAHKLFLVSLAWTTIAALLTWQDVGGVAGRGVLVLPIFALLPGLAMLDMWRIRSQSLRLLVYATGLSLIYWMLGGLAYNNLAVAFGLSRPFDTQPVQLFCAISITMLGVAWYLRNRKQTYTLTLVRPNKTSLLFVTAALMSLACIVSGAIVLNNGGSNSLTVTGLCLVIVSMLGAAIWYHRLASWVYPVMILAAGLGMVLLYSLRSWHVLGWDVNLEYQVFRLTEAMGFWSMAHAPGNEYNACLSITILPTLLHKLLGGDPEYIFKVVLQVLFVVVPLGIYALCRLYIKPLYAFIAALFYVGQTWYIEQLPAVVRQQIAFVLFVALLLALFDGRLSRQRKAVLAFIFIGGVAVSHYSTTYVWLAISVLAALGILAIKIFYPAVRKQNYKLFLLLPIMTIAVALLWNNLYTKTANNSQGFIRGTIVHTSEVFSAEALRGGIERIGFAPPATDTAARLNGRYQEIKQQYDPRISRYALYPDQEAYTPAEVPETETVRPLLPPMAARGLAVASQMTKALFVNILPAAGLLYVLWMFRSKRRLDAGYIAIAAATFPLIFVVVFFPFVQAQYNLTRLFMQVMIVLALPMVVGFSIVFRRLGTKSHVVFALFFGLFFCHATGLTTQLTGGYGTITLNRAAQSHDPFYIYDTELAAAKWLQDQPRSSTAQVYADILGSLRLKGHTSISEVNVDLFPTTIDKNSFVYLTATNTQQGKAFLFDKGDSIPYALPREFLDNNKDVMYSNGPSVIYK